MRRAVFPKLRTTFNFRICRTRALLSVFRDVISSTPSLDDVTLGAGGVTLFASAWAFFYVILAILLAAFALAIMLEAGGDRMLRLANQQLVGPPATLDTFMGRALGSSIWVALMLIIAALLLWFNGDIDVRVGEAEPTSAQLAEI